MNSLGPLFHWSPAERFDSIQSGGLKLHQAACVHSDPSLSSPYLSLGTTPSGAWTLSGDIGHVAEIDEWDLWQVAVADEDELHVRPEFGPLIREIKSYTPIPANRLWWVGRRHIPVFKEHNVRDK